VPGDFLILIGMNGSGKSSTLQALGLVRDFTAGNTGKFFEERGWLPRDVKSNLQHGSFLKFDILLEGENESRYLWQFTCGLNTGRTLREVIWRLRVDESKPEMLLNFNGRSLESSLDPDIGLRGIVLKGSVLALVNPRMNNKRTIIFRRLARWARGITSLELLSPTAMRGTARGNHSDIGGRGEHLASFLSRLDPQAKSRVVGRLAEFYPIEQLNTLRKRAGWVDLRISESFKDVGDIGVRQVSDGFLRLLAFCAIPEFKGDVSLILIDEIEDGIEPHILPRLVERIVRESEAQFIMTSHSPLLVNFARNEEVVLLGRLRDGEVTASPLSELDSVQKGSEFFGGGELWAMLDRTVLDRELRREARGRRRTSYDSDDARFETRAAVAFMRD
jgi:predicted ATPase